LSLDAEMFKTTVMKNQRSPQWKQDNTTTFAVTRPESVIEVRVYNKRNIFRSSELLTTLAIPINTLPRMKKVIREYPLIMGNRCSGAKLTLGLEYINKSKDSRLSPSVSAIEDSDERHSRPTLVSRSDFGRNWSDTLSITQEKDTIDNRLPPITNYQAASARHTVSERLVFEQC